jgi:ribosome-associated toxin RatA of RatAB toxin-antitoxin module
VLRRESAHERGKALVQCIKLAKALRELNNLHGLLAVVSSLRSAPINRLAKSWDNIESKRHKQVRVTLFLSFLFEIVLQSFLSSLFVCLIA